MKAKSALLFLLLSGALNADFSYKVQNANFTIDKSYLYNYDRLRFRGDYTHNDFFFTFIGDGVNYHGEEYVNSNDFSYVKLQETDAPFKTKTAFREYENTSAYAKLYRLYSGYEDNENRVIVGLQNVSMGVGRIWNPTNLFNPRNSYSLEPDETFGVAGVSYTRHLSNNSDMTLVVSQKANKSFKYAGRYKAFLDFADVGVDMVSSNETKMIGYEIEGNLGESGVEVRSEGAYVKNSLRSTTSSQEDVEFFEGIVGADYGFLNGISAIAEALYSSKSFSYERILLNNDSEILPNLVYSKFYAALTLSYVFNIYLDGSLLYIESFNDKNSRYVAPTLRYTFNDYNSFTLGAMLQNGDKESEFGTFENSYYFKWTLTF